MASNLEPEPDVTGDPVAGIVADVVTAARRGTTVYGRNQLRGAWGIGFPAGTVASVHVVTTGHCWLTPNGADPLLLERADVVLVLSGEPHALVDTPGRAVRPLDELTGGVFDGTGRRDLVLGSEGQLTGLLCGGFLLDPQLRHPLTQVFPPVVHVPADAARGTGLAAAVDLLAAELESDDPGAPAVVASLVDLLLVYILRAWLAAHRQSREGWIRALYDPVVGAAIALIHRDAAAPWTIESLARAVGTSRATLGRRFPELVGHPPMAYLIRWRMVVAARLLRDDKAPLRVVARRVGYDSEFAFARAFKRTIGQAPGQYRRARGSG